MSVFSDLLDEAKSNRNDSDFLSYLDSLPEKRRKQAVARARALGRLPAINEGAFTELGQSIANEALNIGRRFGSTLEETGLGSGVKDYFEGVKAEHRDWEPDSSYRAMSLNPGNVARTLGSGVTQSALPMAAGVATTLATGGNALAGGAVTTGLMFGQTYGDRVKEYREAMPNQSEGTVKGLAFVSAAGESLIETIVGPEQLARGIAKKIATNAMRDTAKGFVKRVGAEVAKQAIAEGSEEIAQDFWNRCVQYAGTKQITLPSWSEVGDQFFGGAIPGAFLGGAGAVVENATTKPAVPGAIAPASLPTVHTEAITPDKASVDLVTAVADELGLNVRFFDEEGAPEATTPGGNPINGMYDHEKNEFWIDRTDPEMNPLETLGHEFYHKNNELFGEFNQLMNAGINESGKQALVETEEDYVKAGFEKGSGQTEFSADTFGKMWTDPQFWSDVTERAEKLNSGMGQRMLDALQEFIKVVRAKLKKIGTSEAKALFDNMGELRAEAVRITAEMKRRNGTSTEAENVVGVQGSSVVQSVPVAEVNVDPARFQFKSKANKVTGVDESNQISGEWDAKTAGNLYVWEDKAGKKFVVNGHHRLALAKGKNVESVNAIVDREADGVTAGQAARNGVLINIRDGQGDIRDYAAFVRSSKLDDATAEKEGILSREKGRTGYMIGRYASDNLYSTYRNGDINDARTATIADVSRGDEALEAAGIRAAKNMSNAQLREFLKLLKNTPHQKSVQGDLFGFDDSAIKTAESLSKFAVRHINKIKSAINSGKGAIKNPDGASVINVHAGENSEQLLQEARKELDRWEHWSTDKELYQQLMEEAGLVEAEKPIEPPAEKPIEKPIEKTAEKPVEKSDDGRFNIDSDTPLLTPEEDANDFRLIPESIKRTAEEEAAEVEASGSRYFSLVRNPDTLKRLEKEEYITTYRAAQIGQDGKLYPPMAGIIGKEWGPEIVLGKWEQADERPEMVRQIPGANGAVKNTFKLNKGNGSSIYAAYNPYIHSSTMPLNDQFASAYKRPNLVTLEVRVPKSELTGTYKADMAKDSVGLHSWKSGVVAGQLPKSKERKVILSRWDKPVRIVPESEVAEKIAELLKGENIVIPENVVTPKLLTELEKLGVPIERKEFSLKRHRQVNPIRQAGELQDQHEALINEKYETRSNEVVNEEAEQRLAGNGGMDGTIQMMLDGDFNIGSDVSQRVMQVVLNSDEFKELDVNDREKISDLYINAAGTDVARSLAARRLGVLDMEDIQSIQAHVNAFMAKLDKSNPRNILRKQIMEQFGFDIDNLPEDIVNNPGLLDEVLRRMIAERAGNFDKFYEFWINGILSAPTTHVANMIGNAANAGYELGLKRLAEAAINVVAKRKDAATFKEFKEITRAVDWSDAFQRAKRAFDLETLTTTGKLEYARASIGGNAGRIIRLPGRLLRAADEFAKAIVQPMEAVAYAYRQGEGMGLSGQELQSHIEKQLKKSGSAANTYGNRRALELTFQEDPGKAVKQLMQWREAGGLFGHLLKFTLPFVKTPTNILRQGIRKSPLGAVRLAYDLGQDALGKKKFNAEDVSRIAEQLIAWGAVAMFASMMDDDDEMPILTGSSPRYGSAEQKFKANKLPPYSIRIGENYYNYKRIEPLSTALAFIADGLAAYRTAKTGEDGTKIMKRLIGGMKQLIVDKSFLDSLGEINRIATDPERSGMSALTNFASSWMPNVVRQTVQLFDDNVSDNKSRAKGKQWWEDQFHIITNRMGITKAAPKYDYFGREVKKDSLADSGIAWKMMRLVPIQSIKPDDNMNKAELLMWQYNQTHTDNQYYPDVPAYYFQRDGKKLYFEGEDYSAFVQDAGQLALKQINNAFKHGMLDANKPTEKDIELIKKIFSKARKEIRDNMYKKKQYSE